tara:strand:+ start:443 stop:1123 length:681 start_codon:yes stop_codon:yes gene_type:complete
MPTATSFTTLGKGNGFSSCLNELKFINNKFLRNPPSLAETMNAYWNFDSVSWGGASFNPDNEPKDLICNERLNVGNGGGGGFEVSNALPTFFYIDGVKYYKHGISMSFSASNETTEFEGWNGGVASYIQVNYFSSLYSVSSNLAGYDCIDETYGEPPDPPVIGKSASERTQSISSVTISGIPFIKTVFKSFGGAFYKNEPTDPLPPCPTQSYPSEPGLPTLNLHTY